MTEFQTFVSPIWIYVYLLGPFFILCSYPLLKRKPSLGSPKLIIPTAFAFSSFFAWLYPWIWIPNGGAGYGLVHFYGGFAFFLIAYLLLGFKLHYEKLDAAILAFLTVIAVDQLWQIPYDATNWTQSGYGLEAGIATAAFSFMSLPVLFYVLLKAKGRLRFNASMTFLVVASDWTIWDCLHYCTSSCSIYDASIPYYLVIPWFVFFMVVFVDSRASMPINDHS